MPEDKIRKNAPGVSSGYILRKPTLRQIQAFKAFIEAGTVAKAADLLFVSQPAVSKLLNHLEEDTGLRLLDRTHGKINVTEQGMRLYEEIDRIFAGVDQISHAVEIIRQEEHGLLRVGFLPAVPDNLIASVTQEYRKQFPSVYVSILVRSSQAIIDRILARKLDVGISIIPLEHEQFRTSILDDSPLVAVVHKDNKLAQKKELDMEDLCTEPMIGFAKGSISRNALERAMMDQGLEGNVIMEASTATVVMKMVAKGLGIAVMLPMVANNAEIKNVKIIPLKEKLSLPIYIVRAIDSRRDHVVDNFVNTLDGLFNNS